MEVKKDNVHYRAGCCWSDRLASYMDWFRNNEIAGIQEMVFRTSIQAFGEIPSSLTGVFVYFLPYQSDKPENNSQNLTPRGSHYTYRAQVFNRERSVVISNSIFGYCASDYSAHIASPEVLGKLITQMLIAFSETDPEKIAALRAKSLAEKKERERKKWLEISTRRFEKTVKNTRENIEQSRLAAEKAQREIVMQLRTEEGLKRKLKQLESTREEVVERYSLEHKNLLNLEHVTAVDVDEEKIIVDTDRLYIEHGGKTYDLGNFKIYIYVDAGQVRMHNLTRQIHGAGSNMHAPHVASDGRPCLGNLEEAIPQYIGQFEYSVVVMLCIQYLQTVNVQDMAGKYINNWPIAEKPVVKKTEVSKVTEGVAVL